MEIIDDLRKQVTELFRTELPRFLAYHSPAHTEYVVEKADFISRKENVGHHDRMLITIAGWLHDIGFIKHYQDHEVTGCRIAKEMLVHYDLDPEDIDQVCSMILATRIPQAPSNLNEKILCDADLEYLGTDMFKPISHTLFTELNYLNPDLDMLKYNRMQVAFMSNHSYWTAYCKNNREDAKWENIKSLMLTM